MHNDVDTVECVLPRVYLCIHTLQRMEKHILFYEGDYLSTKRSFIIFYCKRKQVC